MAATAVPTKCSSSPAPTARETSAGSGWALDAAGARSTDANGHFERKRNSVLTFRFRPHAADCDCLLSRTAAANRSVGFSTQSRPSVHFSRVPQRSMEPAGSRTYPTQKPGANVLCGSNAARQNLCAKVLGPVINWPHRDGCSQPTPCVRRVLGVESGLPHSGVNRHRLIRGRFRRGGFFDS